MARKNQINDDLFEDTKMTFGEHLEELRRALFKALVALIIGFLAALMFADDVVKFIKVPLEKALVEYYQIKTQEDIAAEHDDTVPPEIEATLSQDHVVPGDMKVEPLLFLENLAAAFPEEYGHLRPIRYRINREDINPSNVGSFCKQLGSVPGDEEGAALKDVSELLSDDGRSLVGSLAGHQEVSVDERNQLVDVLNGLLEKRELHQRLLETDQENKTKIDSQLKRASGSTQTFIGRIQDELNSSFDAGQSRRLNRLLLSTLFPEHIARPRLSVVSVPTWQPIKVRVIALKAQEAFMIFLKAALVTGVLITSPYMFYQIWSFVAAGLYPHERRHVHVFLPFSLALFFVGASTAFFFVFKPVLKFLFGFNKLMNIDPDPRISEWLGFVLFLPIGFGISFQLPLVMLFMERIGIFTVESYLSHWRIAILVVFVISMLLTPADPVSMLAMAGPLTALYFSGIALCRWLPRIRRPLESPEG